MYVCEHCRENLLDYVYGLLDETEAQELRTHLNACPECQAELEKVRTQQKLLAQAAKAIEVVPEFVVPSDFTATPPSPTPELAEPESTLPMSRRWRRAWLALGASAAAAVLLVVGTLSVLHHRAIDDLTSDVRAKRAEHKKLDERFAALPAKYVALQKDAIAKSRATAAPHLHVVGPMQLEPGAKANVHVTLRNVEGELARGNVNVKLLDGATKKILKEAQADCKGESRIEIESASAKPGAKLAVLVEATTETGKASVLDSIHVAAPTFATRLDTNKIAYEVNEVLFFRALVLDRWSMKPPVDPVMLHVKLLNPKHETVGEFKRATAAGGILAGELPIGTGFLAGNYTLEVRPLDGASAKVQPASQRLEVVRDLQAPDIELNQPRYMPGEVVRGGVFVPGGQPVPKRALATIGGQPVPVTIDPQPTLAAPGGFGGAFIAPGGGGKGSVQEAKKSTALPAPQPSRPLLRFGFEAELPKQLPPGATQVPLQLELQNGQEKKAYNALVSLEPTEYAIDLFPEGGDLIAGVPNHVFFRVRSKTGEAITGDGRVILLSSKNEIVDAPYQLGLGSLVFTPNLKETYTIRVTSPVKTNEVAVPFAKLGIRTSGVVLHVPRAVGKQGEPIEVTLRNQGPTRKLLLVAQCRGQIVDQIWVDVKAGSQACKLETTAEARGMVRVTAYEAEGDALVPVAERLVYRAAAERLNLGVSFNTLQYGPGQTMKGKLHARDENAHAAATWVLASVVDERFQPKPRSLAAHFLLLNEMGGGPGLDDAQVILRDTPEAVQTLERFLGTHGWRRCVNVQLGVPVRDGAVPMIFSRENMSLASLQEQREKSLEAALAPLHVAAFTEQNQVDIERHDAARAVQAAVAELHRLEARPEPVRVAVGIAFVCLFAGSLIMMGVGIYRIARQHKPATPAFGGAFACLAVCLVMMFVGQTLGPIGAAPQQEAAKVRGDWQGREQLQERLAHTVVRRGATGTAPVGALTMPMAEKDARGAEFPMKADRAELKDGVIAQRDEMRRNFTAHARGTAGGSGAKRGNESMDMRLRLHELEGAAKNDVAPAVPVPPVEKAKKEIAPLAADAKLAEREYAPKHAPGIVSDTLLWSPTLWLADGNGEIAFDISNGQATYRVLLLGHAPSGRFGFFETRLDVPAMGR